MAKPKRSSSSASAAKRREQVRQQRQQRQQRVADNQSNKPQSRERKRVRRGSSFGGSWGLIVGVVLVIAAVIAIFFIVSNQQSANTVAQTPTPSSPSVFNAVTHVDPKVLGAVGTGGVSNGLHSIKGGSPLTGPTGKPEFFYYGAEFCPNCAAERWAVVVALSRFGTFSKLDQIKSSEDDISTFTFRQSGYRGTYIDFVPMEEEGQQHEILQTPTTDQQKILNTYNTSGGYPFIDIANQQVLSGANYSFTTVADLSWEDIANKLSDPSSDVAKAILGSANYLTAAICLATNQQPGSVCSAGFIQQIEHSLGKTTVGAHYLSPRQGPPTSAGQFEAVVRQLG